MLNPLSEGDPFDLANISQYFVFDKETMKPK